MSEAFAMGRSRLLWQVGAPLALLLAVGLWAESWQAARLMHSSHSAQVSNQLESGVALVAEAIVEPLAKGDRAAVDALAKRLGSLGRLRVTVMDPSGVVLGESDGDPTVMDNHASRPEVASALASGSGSAVRHSDTLDVDMMYAARAVRAGDRVVGVVRTGVPLGLLQSADRSLARRSLAAVVLVALVTMTIGFLVVRRVTQPLEELEALAEAYASGDVSRPPPVGGSLEVQRVAAAMQRMARDLDQRIAVLISERNEQEAVLSGMVEGVLAIDTGERVMAVNPAAARLLEVDASVALGRSIQQVVRNADLQRLVSDALAAGVAVERNVVLLGDASGEGGRHLKAHGAPVHDAAGRRIGAVIVLHDVTRLRRLETVRSDFVANVSHELKTPVTSIKGFLETLLSGALDDATRARRFVEIAARQADRLGAIIDDLLLLSRVEQDGEHLAIERGPTLLEPLVKGAVDVCRLKAEEKGVRFEVRCEPGLEARVNGALAEQALVNLVDNAVKYSGGGERPVEVTVSREGAWAVLSVRDHGVGIDSEHLPRLFERFYRVDKARSRSQGGTGLGLAIVKHIAQAQGGAVEVSSRPGQGSTFTLRFPLA